MAKFLDKKERVIDFQLTPYGKHRLSVGQLKPEYYAFFDTGVLYDSEYAGFKEVQTKIHERIKTETQFIEGILLFEEAENTTPESTWDGGAAELKISEHFADPAYAGTTHSHSDVLSWYEDTMMRGWSAEEFATKMFVDEEATIPLFSITKRAVSMFDLDVTPRRYVPTPEILSFESAIGDARFEGDNTQAAPAWKLVTCQGEMSNIQRKDTTRYNFSTASYDNEITEFNIPQIDVDAYYTRLISAPSSMLEAEVVSDFISETLPFKGGNTIKLVRDDITVYAEELNTELLTENFDIEVFEMTEDTSVTTLAEAIISLGGSPVVAGDTITIGDGVTTQTFEFMANNAAAMKFKPKPTGDNVGVIVSSNYHVDGSNVNRKGTILNFLSALNQDNGSQADWGYPSDYDKSDAGERTKGRCMWNYEQACYIGNHNLKIRIDTDQISQVIDHVFSGPTHFPLRLTNDITTRAINTNQAITSTAAVSRVSPSGFSGGYIAGGTQLKRKYFVNENPQIVDGLMLSANPEIVPQPDLTADAVEYFFKVLTDKEANAKIVCACANTFNKNSYYVDIDHDCTQGKIKEVYYDIYGSATSPEICQMPAENVTELRDLQLGSDADACEDDN
jgi:hypothetical protein